MLSFPSDARIFLYGEAMNMRRSFEGLSYIVEQVFSGDLTSGAFFAFLNRRKDRMKVLYWDGDGLAIWYKRLEKGSFRQKKNQFLMSRREFFMLLEGITPKRIQSRYNIS